MQGVAKRDRRGTGGWMERRSRRAGHASMPDTAPRVEQVDIGLPDAARRASESNANVRLSACLRTRRGTARWSPGPANHVNHLRVGCYGDMPPALCRFTLGRASFLRAGARFLRARASFLPARVSFLRGGVSFLRARARFLPARVSFLRARVSFLRAGARFLRASASFLHARASFLRAGGNGPDRWGEVCADLCVNAETWAAASCEQERPSCSFSGEKSVPVPVSRTRGRLSQAAFFVSA